MHAKPWYTALATALALTIAAPAVAAHDEWVRVGSRQVDYGGDRDIIRLGPDAGRFDALKLEVAGGPLELYDLIVTFADGTRYFPKTRFRFAAGTGSHVLELPGPARVIRQVTFAYRSTKLSRTTTVALWARGPWAR